MDIDYEALDKKAQPGAFSTLDMEVLVPEVQALKPQDVYLEIGVDKGKSLSVAKMVIAKDVSIYAVDINFTSDLKLYLFLNPDIEFFHMSSKTASQVWQDRYSKSRPITLLFIDGDHSYEGCKTDIDSWSPFMAEHGVMVFHDCDESSPGVLQAVSEFVNSHKVNKFELFKRSDKNTSMAKIVL